MDLRCKSGKKFAELFGEDGVLEVKCTHPDCGGGPGVVVIHGFDVVTGEMIGTDRYREPLTGKEEANATDHGATAVRAA